MTTRRDQARQRAVDPEQDAAFEAAILPLLRSLGPAHVQLLHLADEVAVATWLKPDAAAKQGVGEVCGWLFPLAADQHGGTVVLFVAVPERLPADDRRPLLAASLCRLAWRTFNLGEGPAASTHHDTAENESIHALRNGLNAALMNSAVLSAYAPELPQRLVPVAKQIENAISRSSAELQRLVALVENRS